VAPESKQDYRSLGISFALMNQLENFIRLQKNNQLTSKARNDFIKEQIALIEAYAALAEVALLQDNNPNLSFSRIRLAIQAKTLQKIKAKKQLKVADFYLSPLRLFWISIWISSKSLDSK
jgi:hypothetical protein